MALAGSLAAGMLWMPVQAREEIPEPEKLELFFEEPVSKGVLREGMTGGYQGTQEDDRWQQLTLPIGNSYMGANIYGEVDTEHLTFNHKTLWNGGPSEKRPDYNGGNKDSVGGESMADYVDRVQEAFLDKDANAASMCEEIVGLSEGYGAYQSWGDLYLDFDGKLDVEIIDDRDERIQYDDTGWGDWDQPTWHNGTETYNDHLGSFTLEFEGTGIQMIGVINEQMGDYEIYIDDMETPRTTGTMYGAYLTNQVLAEVTGLEYGPHVLKFVSKEHEGKTKTSYDCFRVFKSEQEVHTETANYKRALDLGTALATVEYDRDGTHYYREFFASYPDNVIAIKLTAEGEKTLDFDLAFPVDNETEVSLGKTAQYEAKNDGTLTVWGQLNDNQMKFYGSVKVIPGEGGNVAQKGDDQLTVSGGREAVILLTAGTDYKNEYPRYRTGESGEELAQRVTGVLEAAVKKGYERLKEDAIADYREIYDRVSLDLGQQSTLATPDLLNAYNDGTATKAQRRYLEVLMFQYGRYLQIASSREGDLPANLQGVWNNRVGDANRVPWGSDYHLNVNLQMNYWPTYVTNMAECGIPMIEYIDSLREPGRVTASTYFGIDNSNGQQNGFTAHTQNTPFGWTCPGWSFSWGWSPAAVPWMLQNVYEYYEYTQDTDYLRDVIFPMMEEEARLYEQILRPVTYGNGVTRLATVPAYSPEHGPYTAGNTYENSLVWQLFHDCIEAAQVLNRQKAQAVSQETIERWKSIEEQLKPVEIGDDGQIKEWYDETTLGSISQTDRHHRHLSHLLGLFPGDLITVDNEDYLNAAVVSLTDRGDDATGWGMGQRINAWARVGDGNHAFEIIEAFFQGGAYPNLWDSHPPFQIDGNFGYTSGVAEMLLQSNAGYVNLLPALPDEWESGTVSGLVARGNFEITESWEDGALTEAKILSRNGGTCQIQCENLDQMRITDLNGNKVDAKPVDGRADRVSFETAQGETYLIWEDNRGEHAEKLEALMEEAEHFLAENRERYTAETVRKAEEALEQARNIWGNPKASQSEILRATEELESAMEGLEKKQEPSENPGGDVGGTPQTPDDGQTKPPTSTGGNAVPNNPSGVGQEERKVPQKGTVHKVGKLYYKVTKSAAEGGTVSVVKPASKKYKEIKVPGSIKLKGYTFRVTAIGAKAFRNHKSLVLVQTGSNVTKIGKSAFAGCKNLKRAVIGKQTATIGGKAFYGDRKLKNVKIVSKKLKKIEKQAFRNIHKKAVIHVPKKQVKKYKKQVFKKSGRPTGSTIK